MSEEKNLFPDPLRESFSDAAVSAMRALSAVWAPFAGREADVLEAVRYATGSERQREEILRHRREQERLRRAADTFIALDTREFYDAVRSFVLGHPAAGERRRIPVLARDDVRPQDNAAAVVGGALHAVSMSLNRLAGSPVQLMEDGTVISANGERWNKGLVREIESCLGCNGHQAAKLWSWVRNLAATGEAPHLFPDIIIGYGRDGGLSAARNPYFAPLKDASFTAADTTTLLWRADMTKALHARSLPALRAFPGLAKA